MDTIETRPQTPQVALARRLLKRRAAHDDELDFHDGLRANLAFWIIEGLHPPFPPIGDVSDLPLPTLEEVRDALVAAATAAGTVQEASVIGQAGAELNGDGPGPP